MLRRCATTSAGACSVFRPGRPGVYVKRAQDLGFTLDEVAALLRLERFKACRPARALAAKKLALVDVRLRDLARLKSVLEELIARCDAGAARGCAIIESLSEP